MSVMVWSYSEGNNRCPKNVFVSFPSKRRQEIPTQGHSYTGGTQCLDYDLKSAGLITNV